MKERIRICIPRDCVTLLLKYGRMKQEHFGVVYLNNMREVIQTKCFFVGSDNICQVHPKLIFWKACKLEASAMILFHNHPSGDSKPSRADIESTRQFTELGKMMGIPVLDHVIVGAESSSSFSRLGLC